MSMSGARVKQDWVKAVVLGLSLGLPVSSAAEDLAPEFEMERLGLLMEEQLAADDFSGVRGTLDAMQALEAELPADYQYYRALVAFEARDNVTARDHLVRYVNQAGREGKYYEQALKFISSAEKEIRSATAEAKVSAVQPDAQPNPFQTRESILQADERRAYLEGLRSLYLRQNDREALLDHLNALLTANPYVPGRIVDLNRRLGVYYRVSVSGRDTLVLQRSEYAENGQVDIQMDRTSVFGINPYVESDCDFPRRQCWVSHPVRASEHWLVLMDRPEVAREIAQALSYLILELQG